MMKEAVSEHSQRTAAAISSGVPIRPIGSCAITLSPFLLGDIGRRVDLLFGAGVVECDVEAPECLDRLIQRRPHALSSLLISGLWSSLVMGGGGP